MEEISAGLYHSLFTGGTLTNRDSDEASDAWEIANQFDPDVANDVSTLDSDADGDPDILEIFQGTDRYRASDRYGVRILSAGPAELVTAHRRGNLQSSVRAWHAWSGDLLGWHRSGETAHGIRVQINEMTMLGHQSHGIIRTGLTVTSGHTERLFYKLDLSPVE